MHDQPTGPELLALARDVLINDLMPLLPEQYRLDARLVANSMVIAEREAVLGTGPMHQILRELESLYGAIPDERELLSRFAHDLRVGAFEGSPLRDRSARAMMWRLTVFKLRQANPRYLTANGFT